MGGEGHDRGAVLGQGLLFGFGQSQLGQDGGIRTRMVILSALRGDFSLFPGLLEVAFLGGTGFGQSGFDFIEKAGVTDGNGDLVGQGAEEAGISLVKAGDFVFLDIQDAHDLSFDADGDGHFGIGVGQVRVGQPIRGLADVGHADNFLAPGGAGDQTGWGVQGNRMSSGFHLGASFAGAGGDDEPLPPLVEEVDVGVVIAEVVFDLVDHFGQEGLQIEDGAEPFAQAGHDLQALGAGGDAGFEGADQVAQLGGHGAEGAGQLAGLILSLEGDLHIEVAGGHLLSHGSQASEGPGQELAHAHSGSDDNDGDEGGKQEGAIGLRLDWGQEDPPRLEEGDQPGAGLQGGDGDLVELIAGGDISGGEKGLVRDAGQVLLQVKEVGGEVLRGEVGQAAGGFEFGQTQGVKGGGGLVEGLGGGPGGLADVIFVEEDGERVGAGQIVALHHQVLEHGGIIAQAQDPDDVAGGVAHRAAKV